MAKHMWLPMAATAAVVAASGATLLVAAHPGTVGCPGSAATSVIDCGAVISSTGGHILGLPLGFWGLVWVALYWASRWAFQGRWGWAAAAGGFLGVAYAVGTELGVGHLCVWCTLDQTAIVFLSVWRLAVGSRRGGL